MNRLNTQIYEEATEWIILHRNDDLDAEARRRFDAWLRESPQHVRAYLEMSTIWETMPALHADWNSSAELLIARARQDNGVVPFGDLQPLPNVSELASSRFSGLSPEGVAAAESPQSRDRNRTAEEGREELKGKRTPRLVFQIAASFLLVTVAITAWFTLPRGFYTTDVGEQRAITLSDGSIVELNAQTRIRVAYTDSQRTIQLLHGQALFKVAKNPNRPFIVDTNTTQIRAVGTEFDVYKRNAGTQVTVVEGRVAVVAPWPPGGTASGMSAVRRGPLAERESETVPAPGGAGISNRSRGHSSHSETPALVAADQRTSHALQARPGEVLLSAGEQIFLAAATSTREPREHSLRSPPDAETVAAPVPQPANIEAATAWTQHRLVFDFTPLIEVAEEFNRYNRRPLIIDDPSLQTFNISGSFSSTDPTLLLRFLREQPGIVVNESTEDIRISRSEASTG